MWHVTVRHRRGSIAIIITLCLVTLLGFVAMAVDWGAVAVARNQVQAAADAAALAATAGIDSPALAVEIAQAYGNEVQVNGRSVVVDSDAVVLGTWDGVTFTETETSPNVVKVTAHADVPLTLTRLFGLDSVRVEATAGAGPKVIARRAPDIVLALDVTGSMSSSELAQERLAAQALLDCVQSGSTGDSKMGIVLFTGVDTVLSEMLEVGTDYSELSAAISSIRGCGSSGMPRCSGTNQAAGLGGALAMLATAETPEDVGQAILLESDGEPNANSICASYYYTGVGWRPDLEAFCAELVTTRTTCTGHGWRRRCTTSTVQGQPSLSDYQDWADQYVAEAETAGVDVYGVYYGSDSSGINYMQNHVVAGDGFLLATPSAEDMADAFDDICQAYVSAGAGMVF